MLVGHRRLLSVLHFFLRTPPACTVFLSSCVPFSLGCFGTAALICLSQAVCQRFSCQSICWKKSKSNRECWQEDGGEKHKFIVLRQAKHSSSLEIRSVFELSQSTAPVIMSVCVPTYYTPHVLPHWEQTS